MIAACSQGEAFEVQEIPVWTAEMRLRIDHLAEADQPFLAPIALHVDADGALLTLHDRERRVRRFSQSGKYEGDVLGPEDMAQPRAMGIVADTLWIRENAPDPAINLFDSGTGGKVGTVLGQEMQSAETEENGPPPLFIYRLNADGTGVFRTTPSSAEIVTGGYTDAVYVQANRSGLILDTIASVPVANGTMGFVSDNGGGVYHSQPFSDTPLVSFSPRGRHLAVIDRRVKVDEPPRLHIYSRSLNGKQGFDRAYAYEPREVHSDLIEQVIRSWQEDLGAHTRQRQMILEELYVPANLPPVSEVFVQDDGRIWIRAWDTNAHSDLAVLNRFSPEAAKWMRLSRNGTPEGILYLPPDLRILYSEGDVLWGTMTNVERGVILKMQLRYD